MSIKIKKLLVANRGEIAIRVLRAASELGVDTVALYTYEDRYSLHRYKADEAYQIGPREEALKPYLDITEIVELAKRTECDAIHPGYGFLSENVEFARQCRDAGIIFVGPSPEAMDQVGNKLKAKSVAAAAGVPIIQQSSQPLTDIAIVQQEAEAIGFPVMIKAASGGGGRGMRVVHSVDDLKTAYDEARHEAERAFGDDEVFIEKYIENPKHIEVQILADTHGSIVHLFERDCSVQRRFQKVVEVAPSLSLDEKTRTLLYDYAVRIAKEVDYQNAGTVEFLVSQNEEVYFIEVNPRIQVEHTVTEEVTGVDLVRSQLVIAAGEPLSSDKIQIGSQKDIRLNGYALQCRITTENPEENFVPDYGRIITYRSPGGFGIRLDAGSAYSGAEISPFFDSLLVKVTASGRTFRGAAGRLTRALREFRIRGVRTNVPFLLNVIKHDQFLSGDATVRFIEDHPELLKFTRGRDRANKVLRYIGEVIVNGNSDVKRSDPSVVMRRPDIPSVPLHLPYPEGTRTELQKLGREGFSSWLRETPMLQVTDTTMRDAHQSLFATRLRTVDMVRVADGFAKRNPGIFSMEVWGGATFDVALRFLKECPWQRLQELREAMPNLLLQMLFRGSNAVGYSAYPDNLIISFIEKAAENGIDIFRIFDSMNWLPAMETSIQTVVEKTDALAEVSICYTGDVADPKESFYTLDYYVNFAKELEKRGAHIIAIKDMAGLLKPRAATLLIEALRSEVRCPIHLHTHDTSSAQLATYLAAIDAGVDVVDCALASMSGLTSQPNLNSLVAILAGHDRVPNLDLSALNEFSNYWDAIRDCYYPFESGLRSGTAEVYEHEIPGGQYSNLQPQARALGLENDFETIKENYQIVNELLGGLIKVTPSSKVVGDLAMYMTSNGLTREDLLDRGDEISFPESVKGFFRGDIGQPPKGFPEEMQKIVLKGEAPTTGRPNDHLPPIDLEGEFEQFQSDYKGKVTYLDYLSSKLYPKVFEEYSKFRTEFGDVSVVPSPAFFFGLESGNEVRVEIGKGKKLIVEFEYVTKPNSEGYRTVYFKLNGQTRGVEVFDRSIGVTKKVNRKADGPGEVGSPLQGKLSSVAVSAGDKVSKGDLLFVIEAMKMETSVTAPQSGVVQEVVLPSGTLVVGEDLVVVLAD